MLRCSVISQQSKSCAAVRLAIFSVAFSVAVIILLPFGVRFLYCDYSIIYLRKYSNGQNNYICASIFVDCVYLHKYI
nr:MAG TPA: hypothetical protein [Caudoviricetes sp.]